MGWLQIILIILGSSVVATIITKIFDFITEKNKKEEELYQKLYGPLIYNLLLMRLLTNNREQLTKEIREFFSDGQSRLEELIKRANPLVKRWIRHKENIEKLLMEYPGYIKKEDLKLVSDFFDGCIKREITEEGKNIYTTEERVNSLLDTIEMMQKKFLK